jgi:hypothetical protein
MNSTAWSHRSFAFLLVIVNACFLAAVPAVAQGASRLRVTNQGRQVTAGTSALVSSSSICSKVSASAVSAIVGYSLPPATAGTVDLKATKQNDEISAVVTACTFGPQTSLAALKKDVILQVEVTSRPLTSQEIQKALSTKTVGTTHFKITTYSGLGVPGFYITFALTGGIKTETISGYKGTSEFGASVYSNLSQSKLAALAKLAQTL